MLLLIAINEISVCGMPKINLCQAKIDFKLNQWSGDYLKMFFPIIILSLSLLALSDINNKAVWSPMTCQDQTL